MPGKKQKPSLEQKVLQFIRQNGLVGAGQKILVAVSGGPDSVCLLHALHRLQSELHISLHIAHLDHQLRAAESEADASYVEELARRLNIPATIAKRDVSAYQTGHHLSLEEAAREVRYGFLAETARTVGADRVAVGHTLDDQVETILLHIIRGTGTQGLRGLQSSSTLPFSGRSLALIRPLLEVRRQETEEYCMLLQLQPRLDASNYSLSILRNRVRLELLPLLKSYNPAIAQSLLRISRIARDEMAFLDAGSIMAWQKIVRKKDNTLILDKEAFKALAPALQRQLLRKGIDEQLGTLKDIETRHIEELLEALDKPPGRQIALPEGLIFSIDYDRYLLGFNPEELAPFPEIKGRFVIHVPGVTEIPGWRIEASLAPYQSFRNETEDTNQKGTGSLSACFDAEKAGEKITIRARQRGDRFQPLGMGCTKKVGEFMLDARIPRTWRQRIPLVCMPEQIIWVAGWRIDERVKVTETTRQVLCLKMVRV